MQLRSLLYIGLLPALCCGEEVPGTPEHPRFRMVAQLGQYQVPLPAITEGEPGLFFLCSEPSNYGVAISVSTQGTQTLPGTFPNNNSLQSYLVAAADGRLYSTVEHLSDPASVVSVGRAPGDRVKIFPAQNLDPAFTQNLPDGRLLALAACMGPTWYLDAIGMNDSVTTIYQFPSGERPSFSAFYGSDGNYYGVSVQPSGSGYLYRVTPAGAITRLYTVEAMSYCTAPSKSRSWRPATAASTAPLPRAARTEPGPSIG
jgi:hypothetical protein